MKYPIYVTAAALIVVGCASCGPNNKASDAETVITTTETANDSNAPTTTETITKPTNTPVTNFPAAKGAATPSKPFATPNLSATPKVVAKTVTKTTTTKITSSARQVTSASGLKYQDLVVGKGALATAGQSVTVHYRGRLTNGTIFDESYKRGEPFSFPLGGGQVIRGWDEGVAGMRVGGKRKLTIPAALGYGPNGTPDGTIPPNATLVFDVELLKVG